MTENKTIIKTNWRGNDGSNCITTLKILCVSNRASLWITRGMVWARIDLDKPQIKILIDKLQRVLDVD